MNIERFMKLCKPNDTSISDQQLVIFNNLLKRFMALFNFENIDETINIRELMLSIIFNDSYMFIEHGGVLRNVYGGYAGDLDFYGYPTEYLWSTGVQSGCNKITDGVVGHSNSLWTPIVPTIYYYSSMLSSLDTSLDIASKNTRIMPIYQAESDGERQQIDLIFSELEKGKQTHSYIHKTTLADLEQGKDSPVIDLTGKSGDSQYMAMLLQAYDNVLARVCRELGINITNVMKRAQVISAEVNGYENYTQIFLDDMLSNISDAVEKVNARWDRDWKVTLNNAFEDDSPKDNEPINEPINDPIKYGGVENV